MPALGVRRERARWRAVARLSTSMLLLVEPIGGLNRSEVGVETVEGHVPEASEAVDPVGCVAKWGSLQVAGPPLARPPSRDEGGFFEHLEDAVRRLASTSERERSAR